MRTILIVEDDTVLSGVLHAAFRREWNVEMAANAAEALTAFREAPPDVVLTDKNMPGMTGLELLQALRRLDAHVGMVVMTAYGTEESASDAFNLGVDAYVEKPFPDLLALVAEMEALRERVVARRRRTPAPTVSLRIFVASSDAARRDAIGGAFDGGDRAEWFSSLPALTAALAAGGAQATVLDCGPLGVEAAEAAQAADAARVPCVIIAEGLRVPEIARLIELGVKALVNVPAHDARFAIMLGHALARIRRG